MIEEINMIEIEGTGERHMRKEVGIGITAGIDIEVITVMITKESSLREKEKVNSNIERPKSTRNSHHLKYKKRISICQNQFKNKKELLCLSGLVVFTYLPLSKENCLKN